MQNFTFSNRTMETRHHLKNRYNNLKKLAVFFIVVCVSVGARGQTFEFEANCQYNSAKIKFDLTNEKVISNSETEKIDVWKTEKRLDENHKTIGIFIHTNNTTYCFMEEFLVFIEDGDAIHNPMEWSYFEYVMCGLDELKGYNFNQIVKAIDTKGQNLYRNYTNNLGNLNAKEIADQLNILAYDYANPEAMNAMANLNMNMLKDKEYAKKFTQEEQKDLIAEAMELYKKAMEMGNEKAKENYNFYQKELNKTTTNTTTTTPSTTTTAPTTTTTTSRRVVAPVSKPTEPTAEIEKVWQEFDVYQNGKKGIKIHVKFSVNDMKGQKGLCFVKFYYQNGADLYQYFNGTRMLMANFEYFTPSYDNAIYNDIVVFIPYDNLGSTLPRGRTDLKFHVMISQDEGKGLALSDYTEFYYTKN